MWMPELPGHEPEKLPIPLLAGPLALSAAKEHTPAQLLGCPADIRPVSCGNAVDAQCNIDRIFQATDLVATTGFPLVANPAVPGTELEIEAWLHTIIAGQALQSTLSGRANECRTPAALQTAAVNPGRQQDSPGGVPTMHCHGPSIPLVGNQDPFLLHAQ